MGRSGVINDIFVHLTLQYGGHTLRFYTRRKIKKGLTMFEPIGCPWLTCVNLTPTRSLSRLPQLIKMSCELFHYSL